MPEMPLEEFLDQLREDFHDSMAVRLNVGERLRIEEEIEAARHRHHEMKLHYTGGDEG